MSSPAVSVVIPLFNKADYVARSVGTVLAQTFQNFELVVVDDGSSDDGVARLRPLLHDSRFRLLKQRNAGVSVARNRGIAESQADLIAFLDADDEWMPYHLEDLVTTAYRFPEAGLYGTSFYYMQNGHLRAAAKLQQRTPFEVESYFEFVIRHGHVFNSSCSAIWRHVFHSIGGFLARVPYGEDQEYWARIATNYRVAYHPRVSSLYRMGVPSSGMAMYNWSSTPPVVVRTLRDYLNNNGVRSDVHAYAANVLLAHATAGLLARRPAESRRLLLDRLVQARAFRLHRRALLIASYLPAFLLRRYFQLRNGVHALGWRALVERLARLRKPKCSAYSS